MRIHFGAAIDDEGMQNMGVQVYCEDTQVAAEYAVRVTHNDSTSVMKKEAKKQLLAFLTQTLKELNDEELPL